VTPRCPLCDELPRIVLPGGEQAFCGTESCPIWCWDPSRSLDENLLDVGHVRLAPAEGGGFTCPRCGRTSHSPDDEREGYCGACHDWTGQGAGRDG
jgi:hypothetical protein